MNPMRRGNSIGVDAVRADFFDVERGLHLAQDGVVDAVCVPELDHGVAFVGDGGQAQDGVLLGLSQCGVGLGLIVRVLGGRAGA
ncbi:hypothetical protein [Streptomyces fagopyri]|uniref:hypothetical protein n=1 Tax=Streptomyces fagopyri TaxID=2662397 RepID=UPI00371F4BB1